MLGFGKRAKIEQIDRQQAEAMLKDKSSKRQFIDVRSEGEFKSGKIKGFKNIPVESLKARMNELDPEIAVVLICATGSRSYFAGRILSKAGFKEIYNVKGGMMASR